MRNEDNMKVDAILTEEFKNELYLCKNLFLV